MKERTKLRDVRREINQAIGIYTHERSRPGGKISTPYHAQREERKIGVGKGKERRMLNGKFAERNSAGSKGS